jgi:hypothetical protein
MWVVVTIIKPQDFKKVKWIIGVWCLGLYPKYFKLSIEVDLFETLGSFFYGENIEKIWKFNRKNYTK